MNSELISIMAAASLYDSWVVLDCETTGLLPRGRLIELGAIHFDSAGNVRSTFHELVKPPHRLPLFISRLTGITREQLANAPSAADVIRRFQNWLPENIPLIAHNIDFDLQILTQELQGVDSLFSHRPLIDTLKLSRCMGRFPNCRLRTIASVLNLETDAPLHRSMADTQVVMQLFLFALSEYHQADGTPAVVNVPP